MNTEALRLLDEMGEAWRAHDTQRGAVDFCIARDKLRALLSAQEPTAEHWRQAIRDWYGTTRAVGLAWDWMERRAGELAKHEAKPQ